MTGQSKAAPSPDSLRELFPAARLLCVCVEDRDACHAGCSWFKERRAEIRKWMGAGDAGN